MHETDDSTPDVIILDPVVALAMASIIKSSLSVNAINTIALSGNYPVFKIAGDYVYLTYGEWCAISTKSTKVDFMDWVGSYNVLAKLVTSQVGDVSIRPFPSGY